MLGNARVEDGVQQGAAVPPLARARAVVLGRLQRTATRRTARHLAHGLLREQLVRVRVTLTLTLTLT